MRPGWFRTLAGILAIALASPASAQQLAGGGGADISIFRVVAALVVSIGAALGLALFLRRKPGIAASPAGFLQRFRLLAPERRITIIEARRLTPHAELGIVRCDGIEYVILSGPAGLQLLERREMTAESGSE